MKKNIVSFIVLFFGITTMPAFSAFDYCLAEQRPADCEKANACEATAGNKWNFSNGTCNCANGSWNGHECIENISSGNRDLGIKGAGINTDVDIKKTEIARVKCTESEIKSINALKAKYENDKCIATKCDTAAGYEIIVGHCEKVNCSDAEKKEIKNANGGGAEWDKKNKKCVPTKCDADAGYTLQNGQCVLTNCTKNDEKKLKKNNVKNVKLENGVCVAVDCISNDYELNADRNACVNKKCQKPEEDVVNGECQQVRCTQEQLDAVNATDGKWDTGKNSCVPTECDEKIYTLKNGTCDLIDKRDDEQKQKDLEAAKNKYEEAKANEQSMANKTLTAATTAATGLGAMELARGLSEQQADKEAEQSMANYIATMRCSYAEGKSVKAGPDEIELPGGNNEELMKYRSEYFALANDLKERKTALGMKPGIESEEILDKATSGLYDDESIGIESGTYASLYRAQMLGSEADQAKIDEDKSASKKRVIGGAVAAGVGVVGGVVGNSLINGKLGEKIKELKNKKASTKENNDLIEQLKTGLKSKGMTNVDKLDLSKFDMTELKDMIQNTDFSQLNLTGKDALKDINTTNSTSFSSSLESIFKK